MSNLEHLIENGLCRLDEGKSYSEWHEIMQKDCNWQGNENITLDNLWEICQYIIFTWDLERTLDKELIRCKDCKHGDMLCADYVSCLISEENESGCHISHKPDWFCADGERRIDDA